MIGSPPAFSGEHADSRIEMGLAELLLLGLGFIGMIVLGLALVPLLERLRHRRGKRK